MPRAPQSPASPYHPAWRLAGSVFFLLAGLMMLASVFAIAVLSPMGLSGVDTLANVRAAMGVIFIAVAITHFFAWRRERLEYRAARQHLCPRCNYDLRGLPKAAPCPECGTAT